MDEFAELINGKLWTHGDVPGVLKITSDGIEHFPTNAGKRTTSYRATRAMLGDDYTTTIDFASPEAELIFAKAERGELETAPKESAPNRVLPPVEDILADIAEDDYIGYCLACGDRAEGIELDAEGYTCDGCGAPRVYGAETILIFLT